MQDYRVGYIFVEDEAEAVFIDSGRDCFRGQLTVYARLGEHADADIAWIRQQPLASEDQYQKLHQYLSRRYASSNDPANLVIDQAAVPR
jgi:phage terminase large subunit GpA-like protein